MSNKLKIWVTLVVLLLIVVWILVYMNWRNTNVRPIDQDSSQATMKKDGEGFSTISSKGIDDEALQQNEASLDADLKALDNESQNLDKSFSDKPIEQVSF